MEDHYKTLSRTVTIAILAIDNSRKTKLGVNNNEAKEKEKMWNNHKEYSLKNTNSYYNLLW